MTPFGFLGGLQLISRYVGKDAAVGACTSSGASEKNTYNHMYYISTNNKSFW